MAAFGHQYDKLPFSNMKMGQQLTLRDIPMPDCVTGTALLDW